MSFLSANPNRKLAKVIGGELPVFCNPRTDLLSQLIEKSKQPHVQKTTPQDERVRFRDERTLRRWYSAGRRVVYIMTDVTENEVAGIAWYRPAELPRRYHQRLENFKKPPTHTLAVRLYAGYTSRQLARPLLAATLEDYVTKPENGVDIMKFGGLWLQTQPMNTPAIKTYQKLGFKTVADDKDRVAMVLSQSQILRVVSAHRPNVEGD